MKYSVDAMFEGVRSGNRRMLAKAISLVESTSKNDIEIRDELLTRLLPYSGNAKRIGITGSPGVGKSSLIEKLGLHIVQQGHSLAVLAIDPSSSLSGGSILGDKVRMHELSLQENVFIRPSPAGTTLGGTARRTRECMLLCEAAGFDIVFVETVGVGQSETAVASMVDLFLLLMLPNSGDDVQGIKRGIMEMADIIAITKYDASQEQSERTATMLRSILRLILPKSEHWRQTVLTTSSQTTYNIDTLWKLCLEFYAGEVRTEAVKQEREKQMSTWFRTMIHDDVLMDFHSTTGMKEKLSEVENEVRTNNILPSAAARKVLQYYKQQQQISNAY